MQPVRCIRFFSVSRGDPVSAITLVPGDCLLEIVAYFVEVIGEGHRTHIVRVGEYRLQPGRRIKHKNRSRVLDLIIVTAVLWRLGLVKHPQRLGELPQLPHENRSRRETPDQKTR